MWRPGAKGLRSESLAALLLLSACSFDVSNTAVSSGGGDAAPDGQLSGAPDGDVSAPDAEPACAFTLDALCSAGDPDAGLDVAGNQTLDTDTDPLCRDLEQASGSQACLVLVESFAVAADVTFTAIGSRPLVIAATDTISIAGTVDVSSRRNRQQGAGANPESCEHGSGPQDDSGGAGGAAGGSYAGLGGGGGIGDQDDSLGFDGTGVPGTAGVTIGLPAVLRAGCPGDNGGDEGPFALSGQGGAGGASGGVVGFFAGTSFSVVTGGRVRATGAGGKGGEVQAGGGGGGSGGMILVESSSILVDGDLSANGGAGGEGGIRLNGFPETGDGGDDGTMRTSAAAGGTGLSFAGDGGAGSSLGSLVGEPGAAADGGGGGGGGSGGYIVLRGSVTVNGSSSPAAIVQ